MTQPALSLPKSKIAQGHLSALAAIMVWGTTFVAIKGLLGGFTPTEIWFFRSGIAYLALLALQPRFIKVSSLREELLFFAAGVCGVTLFALLQNTALVYTLASNVGVLLAVAPFFTALISHYLLKDEDLPPRFFLGITLAIIGVILLTFNGKFILKINPLGDLLAILAALAWAVYSVLIKKIGARNYPPVMTTRRVVFYGWVALFPILPWLDFRIGLERFAELPVVLNFLFLGVGASGLCFVAWNFAVSALGAVKTSVYVYLTPVVSVAASAVVLHEPVTLLALVGIGLILLGLYLSERKNEKALKEISRDA